MIADKYRILKKFIKLQFVNTNNRRVTDRHLATGLMREESLEIDVEDGMKEIVPIVSTSPRGRSVLRYFGL